MTTTRYEYGDNLVTAAINQDGTEEAYEYTLDDRGFVQFAKLLNPVTDVSLPTHYSYDYTNCHLHWRIAYDKNDSINLDATVEYSYDALGQVTERKSLIADELFDYSCW